MNRNTKVKESSELSFSTEQVLQKLQVNQNLIIPIMEIYVESLERKANILLDITETGLNQRNLYELFSIVDKLYQFGFLAEAKNVINNINKLLKEVAPELSGWFTEQSNLRGWYKLKEATEAKATKLPDIFIEHHDFSSGQLFIQVTWCIAGTQNNINCIWNDSVLSYKQLKDFIVSKYGYVLFEDSLSHEGNHTQKEVKLNEQEYTVFIQENIDRFLREYLKAGNPTTSK